MADALIDKSLDDIIKERKISTRGPGRGGRGGRGGARGGSRPGGLSGGGPRRGGASATGGGLNRSFGRRPNTGGIMKRRSGGGPNPNVSPAKAAAASAAHRGSDGQWDHDLYQNGNALRHRAIGGNAAAVSTGPAKLVIANLDFGVNDADIQGLFAEFGNIRKAAVHYDRSGRSLGTADVVFERRADAVKALKKYNGVSLDGRPMSIQLAGPAQAPSAPPAQSRLSGGAAGGSGFRRPNTATRGAPRGGARGGRGGARGGARGGPREKKPEKSAADLDADLDAYNAKMQTD